MVRVKVDEDDLALMTMEMQNFVEEHNFDQSIINILKDLDPEWQDAVVAKGPLDNARNPNAVIKARIYQIEDLKKKEKNKVKDEDEREQFEQEVETYITDNNLDERCRTVLLETEPEVVRELMIQTLTASRNPSAVVLSRIRRIQDELSGEPGWANGRKRNMNPSLKEQEEMLENIDKYILDNEIDERAANVLREQKFWVQQHILNDSLEGVRNPSAVILCRIKKLTTDDPRDDWRKAAWYDDWGKGGKGKGKGYGNSGGAWGSSGGAWGSSGGSWGSSGGAWGSSGGSSHGGKGRRPY